MAKSKLYRGISFVNYKQRKTLALADKDLIKQDILNHIFTRHGERIMMPRFGTTIPDMPFEPLDEILLGQLEEDLTNVINYDPRVRFNENIYKSGLEIKPYYDQNMVIAILDLYYVELNVSEVIDIKLEFNV